MLTIKQISQKTGIAYSTIQKWCFSGKIKAQRFGKSWAIDKGQLPVIMKLYNSKPSRIDPEQATKATQLDLDKLEPRNRAIIEMRFTDKMKVRQIAEKLGLKKQFVSQVIKRLCDCP